MAPAQDPGFSATTTKKTKRSDLPMYEAPVDPTKPFEHTHHGRVHAHSRAVDHHYHWMRAICSDLECADFPTHDRH